VIRRLLVITALFVILLYAGSMVFGVDSLRKSQIAELQGEADLTAQSVAMSLVPAVAKQDVTLARSNIDHVYNKDRHLAMALVGADGAALVERVASESSGGVPDWFASVLALPNFSATVPVAAGAGEHTVAVELRSERAQRRIWAFAIKLSWLFAVLGFSLCLLTSLLLRSGLRPLTHARKVATDIVDGQYTDNAQLATNAPGDVAGVLADTNRASWHVGQLHNEWRESVGLLEDERETDHVTGLLNRYGVHSRLSQMEAPGFFALLRADGLEERARLTGLESSEQYVSNLGATLRGACSASADFWTARIDGGLFAFGHSRYPATHLDPLLERVMSMLDDSIIDSSSIRIGAAVFANATGANRLLETAEGALARAARQPTEVGVARYCVTEVQEDSAATFATARQQLLEKLRDGSIKLNYRPVIDVSDETIAHVVVPWLVEDKGLVFKDDDARAQFADAGLASEFDFAVLDSLAAATQAQSAFIVPVSAATLGDDARRTMLMDRLKEMGPERPMIEIELDHIISEGAGRYDLEVLDELAGADLPYVLSTQGGGRAGTAIVSHCRPTFLKLNMDVGRLFGSTDERSSDATRAYVARLVSEMRSANVPVMLDGVDTRLVWDGAKDAGIVAALGHFPGIPTSSLPAA